MLWICGLPGSGKSTVAKIVLRRLAEEKHLRFEYLSMDELRKKLFPEPTYDDKERDFAYRALVQIASFLSRNGINILIDATAHRRVWRDLARNELGRDFLEVYVKCPVEICIQRETDRERRGSIRGRLYEDALRRLKTGNTVAGLGKVPGVDEPFEESKPEIEINSSRMGADEAATVVLEGLRDRI